MDQTWIVLLVLTGSVAVPAGLVLSVAWALIPTRRTCPFCSTTTVRLVTSRAIRALRIERRWCLGCGWQGLSKCATGTPPTASLLSHLPDDGQWRPPDHFSTGAQSYDYGDGYRPETEYE